MGRSILGWCGAFWGLGGILVLLVYSVVRLAGFAIAMFAYDLLWYHWLALVLVIVFMAYSEGYRGFQQAFAPRVAARAKYLSEHPNLLHIVLAPLFCMGFFYIHRRRQIAIIALTVGIILLILLIRRLDQPWRGIVDAGVVVGLGWGTTSIGVFGLQALTSNAFRYSPEVPEEVHY